MMNFIDLFCFGLLAWGALCSSLLSHHVESLRGRPAPLSRRLIARSHVLHESQDHDEIKQWKRARRVYQEEVLPVRIGLRQSNLKEGHDLLMDMYAH